MKAIVNTAYGPPEVLQLREVARPIPADDEILVKVHAVSVSRSDWEGLVGKPLYARMNGLRKPRRQILGSDVAGRVEAVGRDHTDFRPGDEVLGEMESYSGGFAEYVCTRGRDWTWKPPEMTFEVAAAIPQAAVIALQGLRDRVQPGQRVLINGAGGGAGTFAIQLAKSYGAEVTGVDNAGKLGFLRSLGADHVIDYAREDFTRNGRQYDLILDLVADRSPFDYARALAPGGTYSAAGGSVATFLQILVVGPWLRRVRNRRVRVLVVRRNRQDLAYVTELCRSGRLVPAIDRSYPLSETPEALRQLGEGRAKGKVVITVDG
ncbi:MAG TPA: NAD(P)-dependent alcohol dehydrogenase [Thermoanaerobaculia bacterium]|nr:NAD(P)-dependent alcohol dehydrogenase [Thermoanaerobaculia bacterium]